MTKPPRSYQSASALRTALEERLKLRSLDRNEDLNRLRRLVAFDRLLARLFADQEELPWIVKGGFGLEVRYKMEARTTKDIDLTLAESHKLTREPTGGIAAVFDALQEAAARDIGDYFTASIGQPQQEFDAPPQGGARFQVEVRLDNRPFAKFHLDVGIGDTMVEQPEWKTNDEFLSFAGIPPARILIIPIAQQVAEKFHSYTLPRLQSANSRVKDLVDLVLIIDRECPEPTVARSAIEATFQRRSTHSIPEKLPYPPETWASSYTAMAQEVGLHQTTSEAAVDRLNDYWKTLF